MITGCLQQKNGYYYAVLYLKVDGKRKNKWIPTKLPILGTSNRKAQKAFDEIRIQYERDEEERQRIEAEEKELLKTNHPDALLPFTAYIDKWLLASKPSLQHPHTKATVIWSTVESTPTSIPWNSDSWMLEQRISRASIRASLAMDAKQTLSSTIMLSLVRHSRLQ